MKIAAVLSLSAILAASVCAQDKPELKDQKQKASYAIGQQLGKNFQQQGLELDLKAFAAGVQGALEGKPSALTDAEMEATMATLQKEMQGKQEGKSEKAKTEGEAFLKENASKTGVKTTASGLQYKVLKEGTGATPKDSDTITAHYKGTLINGTEFDSSYKRNEPATFPVDGVIPGWTEALKMMKVGSKWQLFVPSNLAYGERGAPGAIPPNSTLIFEVELLSIK